MIFSIDKIGYSVIFFYFVGEGILDWEGGE